MKFTALAACDPNGVIGKNGAHPWYCPEDLRFFRKTTMGHVMIMGYKTYLTMPPRAFVGRTSFVFTKNHTVDTTLATPVASVEELMSIYASQKQLLEQQLEAQTRPLRDEFAELSIQADEAKPGSLLSGETPSFQEGVLQKTQFVIGGADIFELFFSHGLITSALMTLMNKSYDGDTYFPLRHLNNWSQSTLHQTSEFTIKEYTCAH
jgi:dihydrofolate reductase